MSDRDAPALGVEGVTKSYSTVRAVSGVSFEVRRGEIFGFLGPNGAGKTTTLRMLMGITRPDSGRVTFGGEARYDPRTVGYLPEERGLYEDGPIAEVLEYLGMLRGMSARDARASGLHWLEKMGLADRAKHKVNTLSKGNQQKVQFAGAVLHDPRLVVLDEPFSGLDPLNQELFLDLIDDLRQRGAAVLLSAHQLGLVERLCDRFLLIARGREVLSGTLDEMRRAASGGLTEVLRLDLIGRPGSDADGLRALLARESGAEPRFESGEGGRLIARVEWPERRDLGPVLTALSSGYSVERVEMRPLSLHEIYVLRVGPDSNVGRDAGAAAPAPEPAHV